MRPLLAAVLIAFASATSAIAQPAMQCQGVQKPYAIAELMFGRKIGNRMGVSEKQWQHFVDREITPRFPAGLSVVDVKGQWRDTKRHTTIRERSKMVMIILPGESGDQERLQKIIDIYKARFRQQSVGLILRPACVAF